jgi:sialidase-1
MKTGGGFSKQADLILMGLAAPFLLVLPFTGCGPATPGGLEATASQRVHPVLIRNEHNPLANVTVEAGNPGISAESFTFTLSGTDDPNDIESLELFYSGDQEEFGATNRFGDPARPADEVVFTGNQELSPGKNVFWLSVRLRPNAGLGHRTDAVCTSVETSAGVLIPPGVLIPTDTTPGVRKRTGVALRKHMDDGVHTYRIPALATTPKGTLQCVYDMRWRKSRDLQEDIDIGLTRSTDGGQTWEPQRAIMDMEEWGGLPQEENGVSDPGILVDENTGEIFVTAVWMWGKPGKHQWREDGSEPGYEIGKTAQFLMVRSRDDGLTWTQPENLTRKFKKPEWWLFAPAPNTGITLSDGTIIMPTQGRDETGYPFGNITYSRDHGTTWTVSNHAFSGGNECQAVELSDGSIMLNMRNDNEDPYRAVYVTRDLGQTWKPHATNRGALIEPNCNGSLYRFDYEDGGASKHILLFANPNATDGRHHHTMKVSFDDGMTWPEEYQVLLDEGRGRGYPSISRVDDQHVGIVYEGSRADLVFEKLSLDELLKR